MMIPTRGGTPDADEEDDEGGDEGRADEPDMRPGRIVETGASSGILVGP